MLRVFRVKLKEYVKEPIAAENLSFPWLINGLKETPADGSQAAFIDFRRVISEERLQSMMIGLFLRLNEERVLTLEKTVEHSLMTKMYREIQRIQHHKYNLRFDLRCFDFQVYNITNNYRVGVHKGRQRNRPLDLREFDTTINQLPFHCIFKKRPLLDDLATLSLMMDIVFKTTGSVKLLDADNQCILENNPNDEEIHTIRLESDIMSCNYRSAKGQQPNLKDMKNKQDNLHIIDIDGFMNGNQKPRFLIVFVKLEICQQWLTQQLILTEQTIRVLMIHLLMLYFDQGIIVQQLEDYVGATRLQLKTTRRSIYELKNSISAMEHQQIKDLTNLEYGMQSSIYQLRKQFNSECMEQEGQNSIYQSQLSRLQNDDQELKMRVAQLDAQLKGDCHEMGQYFYNEHLSAQLE